MSTAVMHTTSYYDLDFIFKNQSATRNLSHLTSSGNLSSSASNVAANNNNSNGNSNNSASSTITALTVAASQQLNLSTSPSTQSAVALAFQQQLNAAVAAQQAQVNQQHQQQQQQKLLIHNALQRAVSQPNAAATAALVNSLIENFGHRKLERTQSEPLPQVNTSRYKTELCRPFEEAGECKYGDKCQFAHGMHELRSLQRHPKYKTELCRTFHSVGFCPYGPRCHFVHNAEEARLHNRAVNAEYARMAAIAAAQQNGGHLPLSPPMSMSTGSERASPTGSLSLSPTNSMASFFQDQNSPTFPQGFAFPQSPPSSPRGLSPVSTPPPTSSTSSSPLDDARLPVFNRLSSTIDAFTNMAI